MACGDISFFQKLSEEIKEFLCPFYGKGRNEDIPAPPARISNSLPEFPDRFIDIFVVSV